MAASLSKTLSACSLSEVEEPDGWITLGNVDNKGDTVASPNYASRVDGHVVNLGGGEVSEFPTYSAF